MDLDLSVDYSGLKLRNPVIVGPSDITWSASLMKKAADVGAGAITVKTQHFTLPSDNRLCEERRRKLFRVINVEKEYDPRLTAKGAFYTLAIGGPAGTFKTEEIVPQVKRAKKIIGIPIITSIIGTSLDEIEKMARMNAEAGADAIEIIDPFHYTILYGEAPPEFTLADAIRIVKKTTGLPVSAKITSAWEDPVKTVKRLEDSGVDMIVAVGGAASVKGLEIDVETGKVILDNHYLGCYGSWFRPFSLSWVARAVQATKIPIAGISGVTKWNHVVEYLMVGATAAEICSIIYLRGFRVINEIVNGLRAFMERKGYGKINDFRGASLDKFLSREDIQRRFVPKLACVDEKKCIGCGVCEEVCINEAPYVQAGKTLIDPEKCEGCELCPQVCPVNAISLRMRES
jgi:dihydropyrimidine dehydrogenase (NAD+) subunit PreA